MKKIVNFLILIVVCLLPVMVEAKATFELDVELLDLSFMYKKDNKFFYYDNLVNQSTVGSVKVLDDDYNLLNETFLLNQSAQSAKEFYKHEPFYEYLKVNGIIQKNGIMFDDGDKLYAFMFAEAMVSILDLESGEASNFTFEENPALVKKFLGNIYNLYYDYVDSGYIVELIREIDGYYIVDYSTEDTYSSYTSIVDSNFSSILNFERDYNSHQSLHIHNSLIYVMRTNKILDIYKLDGSKYQTFMIESDYIPTPEEDSYRCNYISPLYLNIINNKLYIVYGESRFHCEERFNFSDAEDFVKEGIVGSVSEALTLVYNLNFDVETVNSSCGEFTYEEKFDEDGKSYVELKVTPKDGYSVKEIIVTDINGERIEVTNNKFYKPLNDVKIEVKYVNGEYLPIPDTFLGKSLTVIIIGLILVGLGFYTINYVKGDSKVDI